MAAFQLSTGETFDFFGAPSRSSLATSVPAAGPSTSSVSAPPNGAADDGGWQTVTRGRGGRKERRGKEGGRVGGRGDEPMGMLVDDDSAGPSRRGRREKGVPYSTGGRHGGKGKHRADADSDGRAPAGTPNVPATLSIKGKATANASAAKAALRESASRAKTTTTSAIATLRKVLASRYNPETKVMNLENLRSDPILKEAGFDPPGVKGAPQNTAGAMWKLCRTTYPDIQSISLANNDLRKLTALSPGLLATELPNITALSLAGNCLADYSDLNPLSAVIGGVATGHDGIKPGLTQLQEVILSGNPLRAQAEVKGNEGMQEYVVELVRRFPSLTLVDAIPIDPSLRHNLPPPSATRATTSSAANKLGSALRPAGARESKDPMADRPLEGVEPPLPLGIKPGLLDSDVTANIAAAFCSKFFASYDTDRQSLMDVYASDATFSFQILMSWPLRAKAKGLHKNHAEMPAQESLDWAPYKESRKSRNLKSLANETFRKHNLLCGPASIVEFIKTLPATRHPVAEPGSERKFVVDALQLPGIVGGAGTGAGGVGGAEDGTVLKVSVHGQFKELPATGVRSFDRTFILGVAGPATAAALKGWPCIILSDILTIRAYSSPDAWTPSEPRAIDAAPPAAGIPDDITTEQRALVEQLSAATKLTPAAALDCLRSNAWEPARAMANFQELQAKGQLPPQAFVA